MKINTSLTAAALAVAFTMGAAPMAFAATSCDTLDSPPAAVKNAMPATAKVVAKGNDNLYYGLSVAGDKLTAWKLDDNGENLETAFSGDVGVDYNWQCATPTVEGVLFQAPTIGENTGGYVTVKPFDNWGEGGIGNTTASNMHSCDTEKSELCMAEGDPNPGPQPDPDPINPVPTLSQWGMMLMGLGIGAMAWMRRRRFDA